MWKWSCPEHPGLIWELHNKKEASQLLSDHISGWIDEDDDFKVLGCNLVHELVDDGVPCGQEGCEIPYIREASSERR